MPQKIDIYVDTLISINKGVNILGFSDDRHLKDAITEAGVLSTHIVGAKNVMDIGSGNGLPAIVLAILMPEARFFLVESRRKKCLLLEHLIYKIGLKNAEIINARVEDILPVYASKIDVFTSKAFCKLDKFYELLREFLPGKRAFALKGASVYEEASNLDVKIKRIENSFFSLKKDSYLVEFSG